MQGNSTPDWNDTIVALSSASGPAIRSIVRLTGPETRKIIDAVFASQKPITKAGIYPGELHLLHGRFQLPAWLYWYTQPRTYTGQDLAEFHMPGNQPLTEQLIAECLHAGARAAVAGEFTLRAFLAGKKDLTQAEAVLGVIEARSEADLQESLTQLAGGMTQPLQAVRDDLLNLLADLEAGLDFVEEDIEFVSLADSLKRVSAALAHLMNLQRQLQSRSVTDRAIRVVLAGPPNAGKSSLFNALLGRSAAIVSEIAGTTRDYLSEKLPLGSVTVEIVDTAGWQLANSSIEEQAQWLGAEQSRQADFILACVPNAVAKEDTAWNSFRQYVTRNIIWVRTKVDEMANAPERDIELSVSIHRAESIQLLRNEIQKRALDLLQPVLAPSLSRCQHHVQQCIEQLQFAHKHILMEDPPELIALSLRLSLQQLGEMVGTVYTNDLLDRIFSRFCIGK